MANKTSIAAGFNPAAFTNTSATGTGVGTFVYGCNFKKDGKTPWDLVAAMKASAFFNAAGPVLNMGSVIVLTDGKTVETVCVTSVTGALPVTVA